MISWYRRFRQRRALEEGMRTEMEFHIASRAADLRKQAGLSEAEAWRQARLDFGNSGAYREEARSVLGFRWLDELRADLVYASRGLRKSVGFSMATVVILALGIAANAGFFTLYSNYALRQIPVRGAERHYDLLGQNSAASSTGGWTREEIKQLQAAAFKEAEGIYTASGLLQVLVVNPVQRLQMGVAVSANYFPLLGGVPAVGRTFLENEESLPLAVLSDSGRRRLFPKSASPIGQVMRVRSTWFTIIGVMPPSFTGTQIAAPDFWVGDGMRGALTKDAGTRGRRAALLLRQGVAPARAEEILSAVAGRFDRTKDDVVARVRIRLRATFVDADRQETKLMAGLLFANVFLVLLIACANLVNLFLSRMAAREHEIATRFALGASRLRIVRQLLTESMLLAMLGAAMGFAIAVSGVARFHDWMFSLVTSQGLMVLPLELDWSLVAYSAGLGLFAGGAFGLFPALNATAIVRRRPGRLRGALLAGQVAASFILLFLGGILVRNVQRFDSIRAGFDLDRTFDLMLDPPSAPLLARLRTHPEVAGVAAVQHVPLYSRMDRREVSVNGKSAGIAYNYVDEHYFAMLQVPLVSGRSFHPNESEAGARVAVVSQATAQRFWPGQSPLGHKLTFAATEKAPGKVPETYQVIGVARDVVNGWLFEGVEPSMVYLPTHAGDARALSAMIRFHAAARPETIASVREVCAGFAGSSGCDPRTLRFIAGMQRFAFQAAAAIATALGFVALLLTAVGLYSVISYSVEQRRREIGVLVAIGARPVHVTRRIAGEATRYFVIGVACALPVCLGLSYLGSSSVLLNVGKLARIETFDPGAYLGVPVLLAGIAALACLVPIRRALRIEPMSALRQD